jgi:hypothetical protein
LTWALPWRLVAVSARMAPGPVLATELMEMTSASVAVDPQATTVAAAITPRESTLFKTEKDGLIFSISRKKVGLRSHLVYCGTLAAMKT